MIDCCGEGCAVFRLDQEAGGGVFEDLAGLSFDSEDHGARTGHELEHLGGNYGLEDVGFLKKDKARVGGGDEGRNFFARLLIEELHIGEAA